MIVLRALAVLASLACVGSVQAQGEALRPFEVAVGGQLFMSFADVCETSGDVVSCSGGRPFVGYDVSGQYRVMPWLALGLRLAGVVGLHQLAVPEPLSSGSIDINQWLWRVSAQARFDPPLWPRGLWFALELGVGFFVDGFADLNASPDAFHNRSIVQGGPLAGLAVGWDLAFAHSWRCGIETRAQALALGRHPREIVSGGVLAGDTGRFFGVALGVRVGYEF